MRSRIWLGLVLVIAAICFLQFGGAIAKTLFDQIDPAGLTFLRLALAAAVLWLIARPDLRRWSATSWGWVVGFGACLAGMNLAFFVALERIPQGVAVSLELTGPLVLSMALSRRLRDFLWVVLAGAGVTLIISQSITGKLDLVGVLLALFAGACWAGYIICAKRVGAQVRGLGGIAVAMACAAVLVAPFGLLSAVVAASQNPSILWWALLVALLSSVIAYGLELQSLRMIPTRVFGVLMAMEPAVAAGWGWLISAETLTFYEALALVLVIIASAGVVVTASRERPTDA